jgi:hypothetical protein
MQVFYEKHANKETKQNLQQAVNYCLEAENGMEINAEK